MKFPSFSDQHCSNLLGTHPTLWLPHQLSAVVGSHFVELPTVAVLSLGTQSLLQLDPCYCGSIPKLQPPLWKESSNGFAVSVNFGESSRCSGSVQANSTDMENIPQLENFSKFSLSAARFNRGYLTSLLAEFSWPIEAQYYNLKL